MADVLVVDNEKTPSVLASYVRALGHSVDVARDARTALRALARRPYDLVFSSMRMASLDRLSLLSEILWRWPDVVVLVTEYRTVDEAAEADVHNVYDYVVEPFTVKQVSHLLDRVLEARTATGH